MDLIIDYGDDGAMLTGNQAAAALANVTVYVEAFKNEIIAKAAARGLGDDDAYALAALEHISDITSHAAVHFAKPIHDAVREAAFQQGVEPVYHVMTVKEALAVDGEMRSMALCGAIPEVS